jgi:hypothetical protein
MTERLLCPQCGSEIPAGSPAGLCPKCLVAAGLESEKGVGSHLPERPATNLRSVPGFAQMTPDPFFGGAKLQETQPSPPAEPSGFVPPSTDVLASKFPQLEILELLGRGGM